MAKDRKQSPDGGAVKRRGIKREWLWAYLFIAPIILGVCVFSVGPIIYSFLRSFTKWNGMSPPVFTGLQNYIAMFRDQKTLYEFRNTLLYVVVVVPVTLLLGMFTANLLNKKIRGKTFFRVIFYLPNIAMPVAVAGIWKLLLNSKYGLVNQILGKIGLPEPSWLSDGRFILWSIIIVAIWSNVGYNVVILLAALQNVPQQLYESALIDGAPPHILFWKITFPMISPSVFFLLTMSTMNALRVFDIVYSFTFTGNETPIRGPLLDSFRTVVFGIYEKAFVNMELGLASAMAVVLFAVIAGITALQFYMEKKWVHY